MRSELTNLCNWKRPLLDEIMMLMVVLLAIVDHGKRQPKTDKAIKTIMIVHIPETIWIY